MLTLKAQMTSLSVAQQAIEEQMKNQDCWKEPELPYQRDPRNFISLVVASSDKVLAHVKRK